MEIYKILVIGIIGSIACVILKETKSPITTVVSIATGIIILIISINLLNPYLIEFNALISKTNINENVYKLLLKIIGIGYLVEYASNLCEELDCNQIARKITFSGKIVIFALSMPIIKEVFALVISLL